MVHELAEGVIWLRCRCSCYAAYGAAGVIEFSLTWCKNLVRDGGTVRVLLAQKATLRESLGVESAAPTTSSSWDGTVTGVTLAACYPSSCTLALSGETGSDTPESVTAGPVFSVCCQRRV